MRCINETKSIQFTRTKIYRKALNKNLIVWCHYEYNLFDFFLKRCLNLVMSLSLIQQTPKVFSWSKSHRILSYTQTGEVLPQLNLLNFQWIKHPLPLHLSSIKFRHVHLMTWFPIVLVHQGRLHSMFYTHVCICIYLEWKLQNINHDGG